MCTGFCTTTTPTTPAAPSQPVVVQNSGSFQLSPVEAIHNDAFLMAFFLPLAFYLMGWSKGVILNLLRRI